VSVRYVDIENSSTLEIQGRNLSEHPLVVYEKPKRYMKAAAVLAVQVYVPGVVHTPEGTMSFEKGDYIVTDYPPTHCWPVKREVFEKTYITTGEHRSDKEHGC
jgi:hypothetical protein